MNKYIVYTEMAGKKEVSGAETEINKTDAAASITERFTEIKAKEGDTFSVPIVTNSKAPLDAIQVKETSQGML